MNYYTYAYLREDGTPYYIGKGQGMRAYKKSKREINPPEDKKRIIFLKKNLTEEQAFMHEVYMIAIFGRKDLGNGILRNKTNGGEGLSGLVWSEEHKEKIRESQKGETNSFYGKKHSEVTKKKLSEAFSGKNHPQYGKTISKEHKLKLSKVHKGKIPWNKGKTGVQIPSEETRKKRSRAMKGKKWWYNPLTNENCMSKDSPGDEWVLGREIILSEETRKKRSEIAKSNNSQKWKCLETGFITNSGTLSRYQRARGIDTSKRVKIFEDT